jgi:hypothetical protein
MRSSVLLLLALCACTTPKTMLVNDKTGQFHVCGGDVGSSIAGGIVGYHVQKSNDEDCVRDYKREGFRVKYVQE